MFFATVNVAHHLATFVLMVLILHTLGNVEGGEPASAIMANLSRHQRNKNKLLVDDDNDHVSCMKQST